MLAIASLFVALFGAVQKPPTSPCKPLYRQYAEASPVGYASRREDRDPYCEGTFKKPSSAGVEDEINVVSLLVSRRVEPAEQGRAWTMCWPHVDRPVLVRVRHKLESMYYHLDGSKEPPNVPDGEPRTRGSFSWDTGVVGQLKYKPEDLFMGAAIRGDLDAHSRLSWGGKPVREEIHLPVTCNWNRTRPADRIPDEIVLSMFLTSRFSTPVRSAVVEREGMRRTIRDADLPRSLGVNVDRPLRIRVPPDGQIWQLKLTCDRETSGGSETETQDPIYFLAPDREFAAWSQAD